MARRAPVMEQPPHPAGRAPSAGPRERPAICPSAGGLATGAFGGWTTSRNSRGGTRTRSVKVAGSKCYVSRERFVACDTPDDTPSPSFAFKNGLRVRMARDPVEVGKQRLSVNATRPQLREHVQRACRRYSQ